MSANTVAWGKIGTILKAQFNCFPQPNTAGQKPIEAILLKDTNQITELMHELKNKHDFSVLLLINAVEYKENFQIIYQLQKMPPNYEMLIIKVNISKTNPEINSVSKVWNSANWYERELWDLQGIKFKGHDNLQRILNPDSWEGFPLRKNYIPPLDALNGPITAVKGNAIGSLSQSTRSEVEIIEEPNKVVQP